ncbi:poly-gamma-glutamate system protein [Leptospira neocaledonica]|uniref:Poly-gamma-glutamate system protein n=1 Tax=Leptospira neocaledonica TaxID=2023192 RepID=A0A2N0A3V1_9LEPT|nr:poly-gamma-glutamate system protein [Leptospira neocaledonica]PJZ79014.1 poly-gamma-glutamate system protein [Leptospira neocaledonica]
MKGIYWKSSSKSVFYYLILAVVSLSGMYLVEHFRFEKVQSNYSEKIEAAKLATKAFEEIKSYKKSKNKKIDPNSDPSGFGLIGEFFTPVTSNLGSLRAKQISNNPNFAALVLEYLIQAGVHKGDTVGVSLSGSFPALNIAVYSAAKVLELKLVIISSLTSSQWGANDPDFLWPDMEKELYIRGIFPYKSLAYSWGGIEDQAFGISKEGSKNLQNSASRNSLPMLHSKNYSESLEERMDLYSSVIPLSEYKAYINVGGGTVSVGTKKSAGEFSSGLNLKHPIIKEGRDSVMRRFANVGIPIIHLVRVEELATQNGFTIQPKKIPEIGEGKIFKRSEYDLRIASTVLVGILALLYMFFKRDSFIEEDRDESL